jgi:hypothetical protein
MFESDFADMCGKNLRWCQWVAERSVTCAQTREKGPPLAPAAILDNPFPGRGPGARGSSLRWSEHFSQISEKWGKGSKGS